MLPAWDPKRAEEMLPIVLAAVGARRSGKSTACTHLLYQMWSKFDLVVAFVGSAACSPCLEAMMQRHPKWDDRFFFSRWNQTLIDKLLRQQEKLKKKNIERHVLIMCDDVILTGKDIDQLAHMAMRGRHFNVSLVMCAVSYTSICKRARRCLDVLLCYSCPMQGDRKILAWEYSANNHTADYVMNNLEDNECVVFETSRKRQKLWVWKAVLLQPQMFRESRRLPSLSELKNEAARESTLVHPLLPHRTRTYDVSNHTRSEEPAASHASEEIQAVGQAETQQNDVLSHQSAQASIELKHTESED